MRDRFEHPVFLAALGAAGLLLRPSGEPRASKQAAAAGAPPRAVPSPPAARRTRTGQVLREADGDDGRGADAATPSDIPARGWWDILKRVARQVSADRVLTEAAAVTFYALLSIFPALAALVSLYGLVADPKTISDQVASLSGVLPGGGVDILKDQVQALTSGADNKLGWGLMLGLAASLWSANQGTKAVFDALNVVNDEEETRGFVHRTAVTLAFTLGAILFVVLALAAVVVLPAVLASVGLGGVTEVLLRVLRWPLLLGAVALLLALLYRYGPSRERARWRWVSWGSAFAAVAWLAASVAFSWYVANFGDYNKTYGSLGAAVGFMTWIWISAAVVLVGGELNAEMERQTGRDTTAGPEREPGARGATKADQMARA